MSRRNKGLERKSKGQLKDSRKVFVIATEGAETEPAYFDLLDAYVQANPMLNNRVKVLTLRRDRIALQQKRKIGEPTSKDSAPDYVLQQLENYFEKNALKEDDELWCIVDRDRWTIRPSHKGLGLKGIARECLKRGYHFCISNPNFELWLLLHIKDVHDYSLEQQVDLLKNKKGHTSKTPLERELSKYLSNGYNKSRLNAADFLPHIQTAIHQAKLLDTNTTAR
jgi:RloB-like protein